MKLHTSVGPNPRVVKMFVAEKGIDLPMVTVDLRGGENRRAPYLSVNPAGQTPALEVDGGVVITEIDAICEYLEELHPAPSLFGATPVERAETRMWAGRVNLKVCEPLTNGFRFAEGLPLFQSRMRCLPEAADGLKAIARDGLTWIEGQLGDRTYLVGERFSYADINLFAFVDFGAGVGQGIDPALTRLSAWYARVKARPSAVASA